MEVRLLKTETSWQHTSSCSSSNCIPSQQPGNAVTVWTTSYHHFSYISLSYKPLWLAFSRKICALPHLHLCFWSTCFMGEMSGANGRGPNVSGACANHQCWGCYSIKTPKLYPYVFGLKNPQRSVRTIPTLLHNSCAVKFTANNILSLEAWTLFFQTKLLEAWRLANSITSNQCRINTREENKFQFSKSLPLIMPFLLFRVNITNEEVKVMKKSIAISQPWTSQKNGWWWSVSEYPTVHKKCTSVS